MSSVDGGEGGQNNAVLVHRHLFGLKVSARGHLQYLDENLVLYPCAHSVVLYNTETRAQSFIHGALPDEGQEHRPTEEQPLEGITALAVAPNRRTFAIAERCVVGYATSYPCDVTTEPFL
jgi:cilia- and flagella-associated protein 57